jgi:hypothetical protein
MGSTGTQGASRAPERSCCLVVVSDPHAPCFPHARDDSHPPPLPRAQLVSVSPATPSVAEGANTTLTLTRSLYTTDPLSVAIKLSSPSGAGYGTDYDLVRADDDTVLAVGNGGSSTVDMPAGATSLSLVFRALSDYASDNSETVLLELPGGDYSVDPAAPSSASSTITIDDTSFTVGFGGGCASCAGRKQLLLRV